MTAQPVDTDQADDAELIRRSRDDPEQFAALFDRYARPIHHYVARRLSTQAADDITAETFLTAFRRRDSYDLARPPHEESREQRLFQAIYQLMGEQALSPEVRAALFRALPLIEGVTVRPDAVDAEGRHGIAFSHTDDWARYELILSPDDFRYLGTYGVTVADRTMRYTNVDPIFVPAGTPLVLSAQLETHLVDKAGQRP
ncbi:sigma factor [Streptosporangium sp. NPDC050855]|uniref:sigma factor n=1 Tax=Streptosporangium sp. NPDC050855 TaxID=3366194 RepID=UPI0037B8DAD6